MRNKLLIFFVILFSYVNVNAASDPIKCMKKNYAIDSGYTELAAYNTARNAAYDSVATSKRYSKIVCKRTLVLHTPGKPTDISENGLNIKSGLGFSYNGITVEFIYLCAGEFQYNEFDCDYQSADTKTKNAMKAEATTYNNWTGGNTLKTALTVSNANKVENKIITVTIDMRESDTTHFPKCTDSSATDAYKNVNCRLLENAVLVRKSKSTTDPTLVGTDQTKTLKSNQKIKLWHRKVTNTLTYDPAPKQIITSGKREGEILSKYNRGNDTGVSLTTKACPTGMTCRDIDNKVYSDLALGTGVHNFSVTAGYNRKSKSSGGFDYDLAVSSNCGYVISNGGTISWHQMLGYRQLDPNNPFPNGSPTGIWAGKTNLFGNEYSKDPINVLTLNGDRIKNIREYNASVGAYKSIPASDASSDYFKRFKNYYFNSNIFKPIGGGGHLN